MAAEALHEVGRVSGKSTLLALLSGLGVPDEGEILLGGKPRHAARP